MTANSPNRKPTPSTFVAVGFVVAAAAIAWFGMRSAPSGPADLPIVTAAGDVRSAREESDVAGVSTGGLPTRIVVPSAGVDTSIAEVGIVRANGQSVWETAWRAAGHHLDSAMPGQLGNMVITGHVSVADRGNLAVFHNLEDVAEGDLVEVYSGDQVYSYRVSKVMVVSPTAVKLLRSDLDSTVTLITCTKDLKNRLVVVGTLAS
jgi:LPXTG-site transpeptidase (sortase) family protein